MLLPFRTGRIAGSRRDAGMNDGTAYPKRLRLDPGRGQPEGQSDREKEAKNFFAPESA